ncbi:MAG TPA: ATP/GTP-binding protein [Streptosporangiaceae bacterium]|nr:ATP/GTP-binding protein [Streptosporangiaceae bacterium]
MSPRRARRLPAGVPRRPRGGVPARTHPSATSENGGAEGSPLRLGPERIEAWPDGEWVVRPVPGAAAEKTYRCPGCDQEIRPGTGHVVAWPAGTPGLAGRRHWHSACWQRRLQRHRR